ncbi:MAG: hypothetical protein KDJ29_13685 [Hyphomicrobiales bacterium]|nr:hypothetical protein [Hyphomicrobiales bacterium]
MTTIIRIALVLTGLAAPVTAMAQPLSCAKCLETLHGNLQACQDNLPKMVEPKNPESPTAAEQAAVAALVKEANKCAAEGQAALAQCKAKAGCP